MKKGMHLLLQVTLKSHAPQPCFGFFETGFFCIALESVLELTLWTRLALDSQRSTFFYLPSAGIKGVCHHSLAPTLFLEIDYLTGPEVHRFS